MEKGVEEKCSGHLQYSQMPPARSATKRLRFAGMEDDSGMVEGGYA